MVDFMYHAFKMTRSRAMSSGMSPTAMGRVRAMEQDAPRVARRERNVGRNTMDRNGVEVGRLEIAERPHPGAGHGEALSSLTISII